jgi:hypothetical protein
MTRQFSPLIGLVFAALLTACGGGGGGDSAPPAPAVTDAIPDSASKSAVGLASYLTALSTAAADDKEPLELSTFNPVQPEDSEPEPLS